MYAKYMTSTIRLSKETKDLISTFGLKGESFETIILRLFHLAKREQLRKFLMPSDKYISLDEFEKEVNKKWPKSR
jgi:predicted CopG family antitoxin